MLPSAEGGRLRCGGRLRALAALARAEFFFSAPPVPALVNINDDVHYYCTVTLLQDACYRTHGRSSSVEVVFLIALRGSQPPTRSPLHPQN